MTDQTHRFDGPDGLTALLGAILGGGDGAAGFQQILKGAAGDAGQADLLAALIKAVQNADDSDDGLIEDADYRDLDACDEAGAWLDAEDDDPEEELHALQEVNDTLAAALGACALCWGGDRHCPACRGRGRPGARRPDPALFNDLVLPAVRARRRTPSQPWRPARTPQTEGDRR